MPEHNPLFLTNPNYISYQILLSAPFHAPSSRLLCRRSILKQAQGAYSRKYGTRLATSVNIPY